MSNQFSDLLTRWYPKRDELEWVLGTIIGTQGSAYRKAGAMLLMNSLGQYDGLLSGGCLESDIMRQAQRVMDSGESHIIVYDMQHDDDLGWQLGIGCGGTVEILLQPLHAGNDYQGLAQLHQLLGRHQDAYLVVDKFGESHNKLFDHENLAAQYIQNICQTPVDITRQSKQLVAGRYWVFQQTCAPQIAVFGAGADARPLVSLAATLGWHVHLVDSRSGYARPAYFPLARHIYHQAFDALQEEPFLQHIDAAVVMGHSIGFDAAAIALLQHSPVQYVGLLGPSHRKNKVLQACDVDEFKRPIAGPIGLNLGGELPESIALSILAEIHAHLFKSDARSLSNMLIKNNRTSQGVA
ncbi:XdhC family protein [Echinimonas agarilytica]|uniref:XdhC family protein n=1 Tax=Echinimonas agarilytica TaxID=1215918 RepID=A0AA41W6F7_9GAMM|nr:XdhC/CoxI family protein [Echinimonas agarilytica]MCM2679715.1 XdhC family protein [Echinimonas agarilytica]